MSTSPTQLVECAKRRAIDVIVQIGNGVIVAKMSRLKGSLPKIAFRVMEYHEKKEDFGTGLSVPST